MIDSAFPPCPSPWVNAQLASGRVTLFTSSGSDNCIPVGRMGQSITIPRESISITCPVSPKMIGSMEEAKYCFTR